MRVLVVEDDERLADVLARGLTEAGHSVEVQPDGLLGLAAAGLGAFNTTELAPQTVGDIGPGGVIVALEVRP